MQKLKHHDGSRVSFSDFCAMLRPKNHQTTVSEISHLLSLADLRTEAERDLARRSITGVFSYFALWLIIYLFSELEHASDALLESLGFLLAAAAIGRLYLALNFKNLYAASPRRWRWLFSIGAIVSAAIWGGVAALAMDFDGLGTTSIMVLLPTAGIAAGGIVTLAPGPKIGAAFLAVLLLPCITVALFSGFVPEQGIALLFLVFLVVMTLMWRRLHHEYWNALYLRNELVRAKEAAEDATSAKGQFIASVSHELRTPLTSVIGALGMITEYPPKGMPSEATMLVDMAYRNGKRLSMLVNDILDFEKLEAHQMEFELHPVELSVFLQRAIELNETYTSRYHVRFVLDPPQDGLAVLADESRLMQVMTNLLSNAAKHSPANSNVQIMSRKHSGMARISVADCGEGVPDAFKAHIFERFSQAQRSNTDKTEGTGLGLAISKAIVEQMGGRIGFDSITGKGATFYFDLPAAVPGPVSGEATD